MSAFQNKHAYSNVEVAGSWLRGIIMYLWKCGGVQRYVVEGRGVHVRGDGVGTEVKERGGIHNYGDGVEV